MAEIEPESHNDRKRARLDTEAPTDETSTLAEDTAKAAVCSHRRLVH
jgi:hypothetical protein